MRGRVGGRGRVRGGAQLVQRRGEPPAGVVGLGLPVLKQAVEGALVGRGGVGLRAGALKGGVALDERGAELGDLVAGGGDFLREVVGGGVERANDGAIEGG